MWPGGGTPAGARGARARPPPVPGDVAVVAAHGARDDLDAAHLVGAGHQVTPFPRAGPERAHRLGDGTVEIGPILRVKLALDELRVALQLLGFHSEDFAAAATDEGVFDAAIGMPHELIDHPRHIGRDALEPRLARAQRLLGAPAFGDIVHDHQSRRAPGERDLRVSDLDFELRAVFLPVPPGAPPDRAAPLRGELRQQFGPFLGGTNIEDRHPQELLARVAVERDGGLVDLQKREGGGIEDPAGKRVGIEQFSVVFLAAAQRLLGGPALGDIA